MNALVVYFSKYGNTRKVAEAIADTLAQSGDARTLEVDQLNNTDLSTVDLFVIGSPTHYQNLPKQVRAILETLPPKSLSGKAVAAFDTSLKMWGPLMLMTAARRLHRILRKLGGKPMIKPETFLVEQGQKEPKGEIDLLYEGEVQRAQEWAAEILRQVERIAVAT